MEIIQALEKATAADLADLDQKIAEATAALETMKTIRHVLDVRLNGAKTKRRGPNRKTRAPDEVQLPDNEPAVVTIMKYLDHAGQATERTICQALSLSESSLADIIERHAPCFEVRSVGNRHGTSKKISLSQAGKNSLAEDREMANGR